MIKLDTQQNVLTGIQTVIIIIIIINLSRIIKEQKQFFSQWPVFIEATGDLGLNKQLCMSYSNMG